MEGETREGDRKEVVLSEGDDGIRRRPERDVDISIGQSDLAVVEVAHRSRQLRALTEVALGVEDVEGLPWNPRQTPLQVPHPV